MIPDDLATDDGKKLYKFFTNEILRLDHRIAFQNKISAQSYLKPHETSAFEERVAT